MVKAQLIGGYTRAEAPPPLAEETETLENTRLRFVEVRF